MGAMAVIAFDLNGTLLDPSALAEPLGGEDADRALVTRALDDAIAQAMAHTLAGAFPPFPELVGSGLRRQLRLADREDGPAEAALGRLEAMKAFPEAEDALELLARAGHRLAVLTNSAADDADAVLRSAGVRPRFDWVLGVDAARE